MRVHQDLTISSDDTVTGEMIMAFQDEFVEMMGTSPEQMVEEMMDQGELPEGAEQSPYSQDGYSGMRLSFTDLPLSEFSGTDGISIVREGDEFVFTGPALGEGLEEAGGMGMGNTEDVDIRTTVRFPGSVTESNGNVSGNSVTWTLENSTDEPMHARGSAIGGGGGGVPWVPILIGVGVLALAGIVAAMVLSNRKKTAAEQVGTDQAGVDPAGSEYGAPQQGYPAAGQDLYGQQDGGQPFGGQEYGGQPYGGQTPAPEAGSTPYGTQDHGVPSADQAAPAPWDQAPQTGQEPLADHDVPETELDTQHRWDGQEDTPGPHPDETR